MELIESIKEKNGGETNARNWSKEDIDRLLELTDSWSLMRTKTKRKRKSLPKKIQTIMRNPRHRKFQMGNPMMRSLMTP